MKNATLYRCSGYDKEKCGDCEYGQPHLDTECCSKWTRMIPIFCHEIQAEVQCIEYDRDPCGEAKCNIGDKIMKKFTISSEITISVYTVVEAETADEAIEKAMSRSVISLCHECSGGYPKEEWVTSGELDGSPDEITSIEEI